MQLALLVVDLDGNLLERFRRFAVNKHGKIYGVLKPEVELALKRYLEREGTQKSKAGGKK
jgi:hypothetical protein